MLIIEMLFNENLIRAEADLNRADKDNIIALCREYLQILSEYRNDLYKLRDSRKINLQQSSLLTRELVEQVKKAIRASIEITTLKRNQTELLLESFTSITGYDAVKTFNHLKYQGAGDWELGANSVRSQSAPAGSEAMTMEESVQTAGLLRREAYINDKITFFRDAVIGAEVVAE